MYIHIYVSNIYLLITKYYTLTNIVRIRQTLPNIGQILTTIYKKWQQLTPLFKTACRFLFQQQKTPAASLRRSKHGLGTPKTRLFEKGAPLPPSKKAPAASLKRSKQLLGLPIHIEILLVLINIDP